MAKANPYITAILIFFVVLIGLLLFNQRREGFEGQGPSDESRYKAIVGSIGKLKPFQDLQRDVRQTLLEGIREAKGSEDPEETLRGIYLAGIGAEPLDASIFDLPPWSSDPEDLSLALAAIPDTLEKEIQTELNFYSKKLAELNSVFSNLSDPSKFQMPSQTQAPEGFQGGKCSAESSRLAREALRQKREAAARQAAQAARVARPIPSASDCVIKPLPDEIRRVEKLLQSINLETLSQKIRQVSGGITKFRQDFQKLKDGTLFEWQNQSGPKKSYATFSGKSNADGLLFSLQAAGQV